MAPKTTSKPYERARKAYSALQQERLAADCRDYLPDVLKGGAPKALKKEALPASAKDAEVIKSLFPNTVDTPLVEFAAGFCDDASDSANRPPVKVGVVLSGGQAPGGHNVIAGIFDGIKAFNEKSTMIGFLDGPHGIFTGNFVEITAEIMDGFRNTGGFDMLGSGRHKIESEEQFQDSMAVCNGIGLDGLVVIGGDDSNTNGAVLAEYFKAHGCKTKVVGAPKTIDGDLKCPPHIPVSFGFDTACKTYATLVGNVAVDALSSQKYYHLVRLMGRSASNIALEVALITRPNACLLGEEVEGKKQSLRDLTVDLADMIEERSKLGKDYGVIVLPEGLIEFIPEFNSLISEINDKLADAAVKPTEEGVLSVLSPENAASFKFLPEFIRAQLLLDRDPHGNVQVAKIETEKLLAATVHSELEARRSKGSYKGKFQAQFHAYGYEGRAGLPTVFDAAYCYALGATAAALLANDCNGLIASVKNLLAPPSQWQCGGVPVTSLCVIEKRKGKNKPVIKKALVELEGPLSQAFKAYEAMRGELRLQDAYRIPGPTQFDMKGCPAANDIPMTLQLELGKALTPMNMGPAPKRMGDFLYGPQPKAARSELQQWRGERKHQVPAALAEFSLASVQVKEGPRTMSKEKEIMQKFFSSLDAPLLELVACDGRGPVPASPKVGVVFCGRQAPGCHDLLCGLVDMLKGEAGAKVIGFVGGTQGFFSKHSVELTPEICAAYRGMGGLELLGRTVDRLKTQEEMDKAAKACQEMGLTGLVLVGGTRTNTDAAYLAEHFKNQSVKASVVGVPCGIEGSMVNEFVDASIGFDSASKAMANLVGNTAIDGSSARKYYYFLKLMDGSSSQKAPTSHVVLEAALQSKPNLLLLTEEVDEKRHTLREVVNSIADIVVQRASAGKNFGTVLVAEGLLATIPEFRSLIVELEAIPMPITIELVLPKLTQWSRAFFQSLPEFIQQQLLLERQSNEELQLTQLETERLMAALVEDELASRKKQGTYKGSFSPVCQYLGYQARCSMPSDFDSDYAYTLGGAAAILAATGQSGYMAIVSDLSKPVQKWKVGGVPFTAMFNVPRSLPHEVSLPRPAILAQRVDLEGRAWKSWCSMRGACAQEELYENPGPIQFSGKSASRVAATIESKYSYIQELSDLRENLEAVAARCRPGCDPRKVRVAVKSLATLNEIMDELVGPLTLSEASDKRVG
mmetsp:Transcript_31903/g.67842  ORF Transcript_31903/g.67842 Transcript_31903/m.67842 type:complete len:1200 (-) Transcript_31903:60-3659(-)